MRNINLSPYLACATPNGQVSFVPTRGDAADCLKERLERAIGVGSDGRLIEDAAYVFTTHCDIDDVRWHLRLCNDTRNACDVAGELAWTHPRLIEQIIVHLDRMITPV